MDEYKRKEYYVGIESWNKGLSSGAAAVFSYLCSCANKKGECFPSTKRIALKCGMCRATVQKKIKELVEKGCISSKNRIVNTEWGKRQTTNQYRILTARGERKPAPAENPLIDEAIKKAGELQAQVKRGGEEAQYGIEKRASGSEAKAQTKPAQSPGSAEEQGMQAVGSEAANDERARLSEDAAGLKSLLDRLNIRSLYEDKYTGRSIEMAITDMWFASETKVCGETVPRYRMRMRLNELDIDAIDDVMFALGSGEVRDKAGYLKSCIYNAPMRAGARIAAQRAGAAKGGFW